MLKTVRGFSLVELMVGIAIFSILAALAAPSFATWIVSAKIRTTAESIQAGLQLARAEAVKRNTGVRFQLMDSTDNSCGLSINGPHWVVSIDEAQSQCGTTKSDTAPYIIQLRNGAEGSGNNTLIAADQPSVNFNGMGRLSSASSPMTINISSSTTGLGCGTVRCLRIKVIGAGQIRMCDPALPATDTQGC